MTKIVHRIKANLYENRLTDEPNYVARVVSERSLGISQICQSSVMRGGADISAAAMQHGVDLFLKEMAFLLCDGYSVNTGYFMVSPSIRGVFDSPKDNFNHKKQSILFMFSQGETLRRELPSIEVQMTGLAESGCNIAQVVDVKSGTINDLLTPDRNLRITGSKIRLAGEHADVGVWFVNISTAQRTRVDMSEIATNNPSELMIVIPMLAPGTYLLEITTQFSNSVVLLKEPRTVTFDSPLTVN